MTYGGLLTKQRFTQVKKHSSPDGFFVKKDDKAGGVRFKAWFVVKGFGQVPGVDFTESYSPVANDTTIRTALAFALHKGWIVDTVDVEAAFLNATLEEDVYMEFPEGLMGIVSMGQKF